MDHPRLIDRPLTDDEKHALCELLTERFKGWGIEVVELLTHVKETRYTLCLRFHVATLDRLWAIGEALKTHGDGSILRVESGRGFAHGELQVGTFSPVDARLI